MPHASDKEFKLYYAPGACSLADHIMLAYVHEKTGKEYEIEAVDIKTHKTSSGEDYFKINPRGAVPALRVSSFGKPEILTQNGAILMFIGDRSGIDAIGPDKGTLKRARINEALGFCYDLHSAFSGLFHPNPSESKEARNEQIRKTHARIKKLEDWLKDENAWWLGDDFTQADAYASVILSWCRRLDLDLSAYPKSASLMRKVFSLKSAQAALKAEGLDADAYGRAG